MQASSGPKGPGVSKCAKAIGNYSVQHCVEYGGPSCCQEIVPSLVQVNSSL